ncbi:hypothetical protein [Acinetobacter proteolyticus]|uniref:Uncharacterized protein n=1 Tax=Acinetobacter proteolyticus TaxID=1776741 RepID=A0A2N0WIC7_9GAMM|nr:hypothetical protein [Acinetobacter proteolyticus]MBK5646835.1 hypothetical protein [Acinetobacter sp.]PKF35557.1 hypothetical protein CW311_04510 [Acinetobacter proteolyticus]
MKLGAIVEQFLAEERSVAVLLPESQVQALAVAATAFYCGYSDLASVPKTQLGDITLEAVISIAEWAVIKPLFLLYVERETALQTEATGMQGVGGFGRNSSEVNIEISNLEREFPQKATCVAVITIGGDEAASPLANDYNFPYGFQFPIY